MYIFNYYDGSTLTGYDYEVCGNDYFVDAYRIIPASDIESIEEVEDIEDELLSEDELKELDAKRLSFCDDTINADFIGIVWEAYGNRMYYRFTDGTYGYKYKSIGE